MDKIVNADGTVSYMYNSEYTISFDRSIAVEGTEDKLDVKQTLYISKKNESGNYYVFTEIHFLDATAESLLQGITLDTICEVSESSLKCLTFLADDWIYPSFAEININHTQKIEIFSNGYNAEFDLITSTLGNNVSVMQIQYMDNKTNQKYATFHGISFKDKQGNSWYITPASVKVYAKNGTELKPSTRKYDHNAYGEQVQVMDGYAEAVDGTKVYVSADYVTVISGGAPEYYLRYENTSFKKLFGTITSMKIAEGYEITSDDEKALLADESKHQLTVKITNTENEVFTYNFYELTARKSYLTIGEGDEQVGGFYVQATKVAKILNDVERFFNGELIDPDAHK